MDLWDVDIRVTLEAKDGEEAIYWLAKMMRDGLVEQGYYDDAEIEITQVLMKRRPGT